MLSPLAVCLALSAAQSGQGSASLPSPSIVIDECVDADRDEVVRLLAIELASTFPAPSAPRSIVVTCTTRPGIVRLHDPQSPAHSSRLLDLTAFDIAAKKARTRELALVIAELVRERPPAVQQSSARQATPVRGVDVARLELELLAGAEKYSGGHAQAGLGLGLKLSALGRWVFEARLGGRVAPQRRAPDGVVDATGLVGAVGVGVSLLPEHGSAGIAALARLELDWIFVRGTSTADALAGEPRAVGTSANGAAWVASFAASAWLTLSSSLRVVAEPALLLPIQPLSLEDRSARVSSISGIGGAATLGLQVRL